MRLVFKCLLFLDPEGARVGSLTNYAGLVFYDTFLSAQYPVFSSLNGTYSTDANAKRIATDTENLITLEAGPAVASLSAPASETVFATSESCHVKATYTAE
jgi:hypothetical protein